MARMRVALTGGIGSGKSSVAALLAGLGAVVIDADELAREAVAPGTAGLRAVLARFGPSVLRPDGALDRAALGRIVFADDRARGDLNAIVHPEVRRLAAERERVAPDDAVVVHVIPLLVETAQERSFDAVVVVDAPEDVQVARVMARDGVDAGAARSRLRAQASRAKRLGAATHVLDNSGAPDLLPGRVADLWAQLTADNPAGDADRPGFVSGRNYPR